MVKKIIMALTLSLNCSLFIVDNSNITSLGSEFGNEITTIHWNDSGEKLFFYQDNGPGGSETPIVIRKKVKKALDNSIIIGATVSVYRGSATQPIITVESTISGYELSLLSGDMVEVCKQGFLCKTFYVSIVTSQGDDLLYFDR